MPDEAFEAFWKVRGGPELVALHTLFSGSSLALEKIRELLALTPDQLRGVVAGARELGLIEGDDRSVTFFALPADSSQRARLDWCMEPHGEEFNALLTRLRARMLVRFLSTPPATS